MKKALFILATAGLFIAAANPSVQEEENKEIAMTKCTKDETCGGSSGDACKKQSSDASKEVQSPRKSAAQRVIEGQ